MEETRQVPKLVHVLRQSFRPSEQLGSILEGFLPPESKRTPSSVEIKSLGMLAIDAYLHANHTYSLQLFAARKAIEENQNQSFAVLPDIEIRNVNENTLDLFMGVHDAPAMYLLNRTTRRFLPEAVRMRDKADEKFSVYARIKSSVPITENLQKLAVEQYTETYQRLGPKRLLTIFPQALTGNDQRFNFKQSKPSEQTA